MEANTVRCRGCPLGSLVPQLAQTDEQARAALAASLARWTVHLSDGLRAMQGRQARPSADPDRLATATLAAIQGGLVLTQARRDPPTGDRADAAYDHLRAHAASTRGRVV